MVKSSYNIVLTHCHHIFHLSHCLLSSSPLQAHSGYGGTIANGEPHGTGHHLYHSSNFGLVMVADRMYGEQKNGREQK